MRSQAGVGLVRTGSVLFAVALIFLGTTQVNAQVQGPALGAKVGISWSNLRIDPDSAEQSRLTSLTGGGFVRFDLGRIGLQPELMIVTKGSKTDPDFEDVEGKIKLDYIEVPVLLYVPLLEPGATPYLIGGPAIAFEIGCEVEAEFGGIDITAECDDDADDADNDANDRDKVDFGIIAGVGLNVPAGPGSALIEARYTFGLRKIIEGPGFNAKNRSLAIMAGYSIPLAF